MGFVLANHFYLFGLTIVRQYQSSLSLLLQRNQFWLYFSSILSDNDIRMQHNVNVQLKSIASFLRIYWISNLSKLASTSFVVCFHASFNIFIMLKHSYESYKTCFGIFVVAVKQVLASL